MIGSTVACTSQSLAKTLHVHDIFDFAEPTGNSLECFRRKYQNAFTGYSPHSGYGIQRSV